MARTRLLALDIDGTLVDLEDRVSAGVRRALQQAREAGIEIVLATGRRYSRVLPLVDALGISTPLVTASGALVKDPATHRTLYRADFARELLLEALAVIDRAGHEALLYADTFHEGFDFYCRTHETASPELGEFLAKNHPSSQLWPAIIAAPPPEVFGAFAMGTRDQMIELERQLEARLPEQLYVHVIRSPKYRGFMCEIAPLGATKWSGIQHLAALHGIEAEEICAVGDDVNDIPMLEGSGLGVAMGNAQAEVQAAADRVAPTLAEDGLVQAVAWALERV